MIDLGELARKTGVLCNPPLAWALCTALPSLYAAPACWKLLYHSPSHGCGSNRFQHHTFKYEINIVLKETLLESWFLA
jgi:hypothetical protein